MKRFFLLVSLSVFLPFFSSAAWGGPTLMKAEGRTERMESESDTKKNALDSAFRNAISGVLKFSIDEGVGGDISELMEERIFPNMLKYVINYKILSEGWVTHSNGMGEPPADNDNAEGASPGMEDLSGGPPIEEYRVWIEANLDVDGLKKDIMGFISIGKEGIKQVEIVLLNVYDYKKFEEMKKVIERLDIVKELIYGSFSRGRIVLNASIAGDMEAFRERLWRGLGEDFVVIPEDGERLIIREESGGG